MHIIHMLYNIKNIYLYNNSLDKNEHFRNFYLIIHTCIQQSKLHEPRSKIEWNQLIVRLFDFKSV